MMQNGVIQNGMMQNGVIQNGMTQNRVKTKWRQYKRGAKQNFLFCHRTQNERER
jgi:hypothetical protein